MRKKICRFFAYILLVSVICCLIPNFEAHADNEEFVSALKDFLGHEPSSDEQGMYSLIITTLQSDGLTANAIAGLLGNLIHESRSPWAIESHQSLKTTSGVSYYNFSVGNTYVYTSKPPLYTSSTTGRTETGLGHGLLQWSYSRATNLSNFAQTNSGTFGNVKVTHYLKDYGDSDMYQHTCYIPEYAGQVAFIVQELNGSYASCKSLMNSAASAYDAAGVFLDEYEKPDNRDYVGRGNSANAALPAVEACTGLVGTTGSGSGSGDSSSGSSTSLDDAASKVGSYLTSSGIWGEDEISAFCKLTELDINEVYLNNASKDNLEQDDLEGLVNWERNVDSANKENGWIAFLRRVVAFIGIIFIVWSLLIYLAYWLDNINNIVEISTLSIVTFGQLHICYGDDEPTFRLGKENGKVKTVSHSQIVGICLIEILFGVSLVSGFFYQVVSYFVNLVLEILGLV